MSYSKTGGGPRPQCLRDARGPTVILIPVAPINSLDIPRSRTVDQVLHRDVADKRPDSGASSSGTWT
jgi:hypothetical protein